MNKAKYVDKMTDLVEDTLQKKGVSDDFTIADNYDEAGEMSMTLAHDRTGHEQTFPLQGLYDRKKEGDVKVKDQYRDELKAQVEGFVDRELASLRAREAAVAETPGAECAPPEEDDEEFDYEDDEDEDYEDEEGPGSPRPGENTPNLNEPDEEAEQAEAGREDGEGVEGGISASITGLFKPLSFVNVDSSGSVKAAVLPPAMQNKAVEELAARYRDQICALYGEGSFVVHPNRNDIVVFDAVSYSVSDVGELLADMMGEGGASGIATVENDKEPELP